MHKNIHLVGNGLISRVHALKFINLDDKRLCGVITKNPDEGKIYKKNMAFCFIEIFQNWKGFIISPTLLS